MIKLKIEKGNNLKLFLSVLYKFFSFIFFIIDQIFSFPILNHKTWFSLSSLVYLTNHGKIYKKVLGFNNTSITDLCASYRFLIMPLHHTF